MTSTFDDTSPAGPAVLSLTFEGKARDYFRVWIVNLCLTLFTLGLFSPWAKVRKQRYLHANTVLAGTPFQYLGNPVAILRGRLVAVTLFAVYYLTGFAAPQLTPFVLAAAVVVAPWVIVQSAAFGARYRAYRNMTFGFQADYASAVAALYWLGVIPALVTGYVFEWWGDARISGAMVLAAGVLFPFWMLRMKRFMINHTAFGGQGARLEVRSGALFRIYFAGGLILVAAGIPAGVFGYFLEPSNTAGALGAILVIYVGYVVSFAYVKANADNLIWNHTRLGPLKFQSTLKTWPLFAIYAGNTLGILASCGLLIPWAVIRTLRYRVGNLCVEVAGDLAMFRQSQGEGVGAEGGEIGDVFQLDLSL